MWPIGGLSLLPHCLNWWPSFWHCWPLECHSRHRETLPILKLMPATQGQVWDYTPAINSQHWEAGTGQCLWNQPGYMARPCLRDKNKSKTVTKTFLPPSPVLFFSKGISSCLALLLLTYIFQSLVNLFNLKSCFPWIEHNSPSMLWTMLDRNTYCIFSLIND